MRELESYRPILQGEATVSLPQLQKALGCSYPEAKAALKQLQEACWAGKQVSGIFYELNTKLIAPQELSQEACQALADELTSQQLHALEMLDADGITGLRRERYRETVEELCGHGLAHIFGDGFFCSVTEETVKRIKDARIPETENVLEAYIANPILVNAVALDVDPEPLLQLAFVPKWCKGHVRGGLLGRQLSGETPRPVRYTGKANKKALGYELVEALVAQLDLPGKEEYEEAAKACLMKIENSVLCSEEFKEAARWATAEICEGLTLSNLREIRNIIASHTDDDDTEEDED